MRLSVVATLYRSAPYLREFCARAAAAAERVSPDFEIVLVNDGSPDDALAVALDIRAADPRVRVVDLSRNFGHHPAILTGLRHARGDEVFLIDCDLEEAPEWVEAFAAVRRADPDADVVYGVQRVRRGGAFDRLAGAAFYRLFNMLSADKLPPNLVTARLMSRRFVRALLRHPEVTLMLGALAYFGRYFVWSTDGVTPAIAVTSQLLHGFGYAFFFASAYIYVDRIAPPDVRHSAQTMFGIVMLGGGPILGGAFLNRWLAEANTVKLVEGGVELSKLEFGPFFLTLSWIGLGVAALVLWAFRDETKEKTT